MAKGRREREREKVMGKQVTEKRREGVRKGKEGMGIKSSLFSY